jgi:hypothetical protein
VAFPNSDRLNFRNMTDDDLECMAEMLGDPEVMAFYLGRKLRKRRRPGSTGTRRTTKKTASGSGLSRPSRASSSVTAA